MDQETIDAIARGFARQFSRRGIVGGSLGVALMASGPLGPDAADASRRRKKKRRKKKKEQANASPPTNPDPSRATCSARCAAGETCTNGQCVCAAPSQQLPRCFSNEKTGQPEEQHCVDPAGLNVITCCPKHRIFVQCPYESENDITYPCGTSADQLESVCCPDDRICGDFCCEGPHQCNPQRTKCVSNPPRYARVRRP